MLMPINGFGHRTFGINTSDWARYFADICADFKFLPFPERLAQTGLPQEFLDQWPFAVDGLAVVASAAAADGGNRARLEAPSAAPSGSTVFGPSGISLNLLGVFLPR